jgi:hypothetical protein
MIIDTEKLLAAVDRHYMARCKTVEDTLPFRRSVRLLIVSRHSQTMT